MDLQNDVCRGLHRPVTFFCARFGKCLTFVNLCFFSVLYILFMSFLADYHAFI